MRLPSVNRQFCELTASAVMVPRHKMGLPFGSVPDGEEVQRVLAGLGLGEVVHRVPVIAEDEDLAVVGVPGEEVAVVIGLSGPVGALDRLAP